ncbi:cation channel sperm-associated protein subunit delta-domain-containing protein [Gorgonomyces haynaldii]|nr:cation channel sperm-associated protein subunit delta-domain-containing protein [Gorgonomyces haynaldii]
MFVQALSFGYNRPYFESLTDGRILVNVPFKLGLSVVSSNATWTSVSGNCQFKDTGSYVGSSITSTSQVTALCTSVNNEVISVYKDGDTSATDSLVIPIEQGPCFRWYSTDTLSSTGKLYVWIIDPKMASQSELDGSAIVPSSTSTSITRALYGMGEFPIIGGLNATGLLFDNLNNYWTFNVTSSVYGPLTYTVSGQGVQLLNCAAASSKSVAYYNNRTWTLSTASVGSSSLSYFRVYQSPCNRGILATTSHLFGDGILSVSYNLKRFGLYSVPPGLATGNNLTSIVFTNSTMVILSNGKIASGESTMSLASGTASTLTHLTGPNVCDTISNTFMNQVVVTWNKNSLASNSQLQIYVSLDGGKTFSTATLDVTTGSYVQDVEIVSSAQRLCVLIRDGSVDKTVLVSLQGQTIGTSSNGYTFSSFGLDNGKGSTLGFGQSTGLNVFCFGDKLGYSPDGGSVFFEVLLYSLDPQRPASGLGATEYITQVITSDNARFAVLTSNNRVFYGIVGAAEAYELVSGIPVGLARLIFDPLDQLIYLSPNASSPYVNQRLIPSANQFLVPRWPDNTKAVQNVCPFDGWSIELAKMVYLDKNQTTCYPYTGTDITFSVTNADLITVTKKNSSLCLSPKATQTGAIDLRVEPAQMNLGCTSGAKQVVVELGCPPSRSIAYIVPSYTTYYTYHYPYTTSSVSMLKPTPTSQCNGQPTQVNGQSYDCLQYGTPIPVYYGQVFVPKFALFDNNGFVDVVQADMTVFEVNGKSISFNTTHKQAGCKTKQSVTESTVGQYTKCFTSGSISESDLSSAYPILNASNYNGIKWTNAQNGLYLFRAYVADQSYSFCNLTTTFAVIVDKAPLGVGVSLGIVMGVVAFAVLVLGTSYVIFARSKNRSEKEKQE